MMPVPELNAVGVFVTGTDTGVGKTLVAVALLRALRTRGARAAGMKPVAAGLHPGEASNADVVALANADGLALAAGDRNPYVFVPFIAPHLAALEAGVVMDLAFIAAAYRRITAVADVVVVEGAGGAMVPLSRDCDMLDLAQALELPVLLVVGMRLGCINHALLSARALEARGLALAGWVANAIDPSMPRFDANIESIGTRLGRPAAAVLHWASPEATNEAALDPLACTLLRGAGQGRAPKS